MRCTFTIALMIVALAAAGQAAWAVEASALRLVPMPREIRVDKGTFPLDGPLIFEAPAASAKLLGQMLADEGLTHAEVRVGDAQEPELAPSAYDVVGSSAVLFFLPDPRAALEAWRDALVPGGRIGVSTFGPQDEAWDSVDDVFTPYLHAAMLEARTNSERGPFASDAGVESLLDSAGFADVRTVVADLAIRFADADQWYAFSMSHGQRAIWALVPESERVAVRTEAERRLAPAGPWNPPLSRTFSIARGARWDSW